jgi:hypothetical protein
MRRDQLPRYVTPGIRHQQPLPGPAAGNHGRPQSAAWHPFCSRGVHGRGGIRIAGWRQCCPAEDVRHRGRKGISPARPEEDLRLRGARAGCRRDRDLVRAEHLMADRAARGSRPRHRRGLPGQRDGHERVRVQAQPPADGGPGVRDAQRWPPVVNAGSPLSGRYSPTRVGAGRRCAPGRALTASGRPDRGRRQHAHDGHANRQRYDRPDYEAFHELPVHTREHEGRAPSGGPDGQEVEHRDEFGIGTGGARFRSPPALAVRLVPGS